MSEDKPKLRLVPTDPYAKPDSTKLNPDDLHLWTVESVGDWLRAGRGVAGTEFDQVEDIYDLLERFEVGIKVVGKELDVDFDHIFRRWIEKPKYYENEGQDDEDMEFLAGAMFEAIEDQDTMQNVRRVLDAINLYQHVHMARLGLKDDDAKGAAWRCALAAEAAIKLKGRTAEKLLESGFKHTVESKAKQTEWHQSLVKAAKRELKAGTPERKIVGLMHQQFSSKSTDAIRRALKKHGVLK